MQHGDSQFWRLFSIHSYYRILAQSPVLCNISVAYSIRGSLHLLIPYPYIASPPQIFKYFETSGFICCFKIYSHRDFPGGPMVKNLPCNAGDAILISYWGTKIPHATEQLSPSTTATEPCASMYCSERSRMPMLLNR